MPLPDDAVGGEERNEERKLSWEGDEARLRQFDRGTTGTRSLNNQEKNLKENLEKRHLTGTDFVSGWGENRVYRINCSTSNKPPQC